MNKEQSETDGLEHIEELLAVVSDYESLVHLSDPEVTSLLAAIDEAEDEAGEQLEDAELLLGAVQRAQEVLRGVQTYRRRFEGRGEAFTTERTPMISKPSENKAFAAPPTREESPAYKAAEARLEELNLACRESSAAYDKAVREATRVREDQGPRPAPDSTSKTFRTPGPGYEARVAAADQAVLDARRAKDDAGHARRAYLQSRPFPRPYPPHFEAQRQVDVAAAKRRQQLAEDLQAIGAQR